MSLATIPGLLIGIFLINVLGSRLLLGKDRHLLSLEDPSQSCSSTITDCNKRPLQYHALVMSCLHILYIHVYYLTQCLELATCCIIIIFPLLEQLSFVNSCLVLAVSMVVSALSTFLIWGVDKTTSNIIILSCLFTGFSTVGWNALNVIVPELFPVHLRCVIEGTCRTGTDWWVGGWMHGAN